MFERECTEFSKLYPETLVGVFGDNTNDEIKVGRNPRHIEELRYLGIQMRDNMRNALFRGNMKRSNKKYYKRNQNNHVRMTS